MRDERHQPCGLDVLRERPELLRRSGEWHLDEDEPRPFEHVAHRILLEQRRRRSQLEAEPKLERRVTSKLLERLADDTLTLLCQHEMRPHVRSCIEDLRSGPRRDLAEFDSVRVRLSAVVTRGNDVRMTVDEPGPHPERLLAAEVELEARSDHPQLAE